jgi:hypothetical protein
MLITEGIPITELASIFSSSINQTEGVLCHCYKRSLSIIDKGATQKTQEEDE